MTPDEIAAERKRFEDFVKLQWPSLELDRDEYQYLDVDVQGGWEMWRERAEIARAENAELRAENERLRAENAELRALIENNNAVAEMCGLDLPKPDI